MDPESKEDYDKKEEFDDEVNPNSRNEIYFKILKVGKVKYLVNLDLYPKVMEGDGYKVARDITKFNDYIKIDCPKE